MMLSAAAASSIVLMMTLTCLDVIGRVTFNRPLKGTYDLVGVLAGITLSASLPYTTSLKGHVAIEFLFLKLSRRGRRIGNVFVHSVIAALFVFFTWECIRYGRSLHRNHQGMVTLGWPVYWVPYVIAFCCLVTVLVVLEHILHPDRELIKP